MTHCHTFSQKLFDFVQGDLPEGEAGVMRTHAAACAPCATLLATERALVETLTNLPAAPTCDVPEPVLPRAFVEQVAPVLQMRDSGRTRRWWAHARLGAAVALVSAAGLLWAIQLSGAFEPLGTTASEDDAVQRSVPVEITTVLASESTLPQVDDHFLALTAGVEAVVMRRPAQDRCANGLCASGR
jgi:anti-sigma factor RsiW